MNAKNKRSNANKLGILSVLCLFIIAPFIPVFFDYGASSRALGHFHVAVASFMVMFTVMASLHWLSQLVSYSLPDGWFRQRPFETLQFYARMGVKYFRKALLRSPFAKLNEVIHLTKSGKEALRELETHMRNSETNHVIAFVVTLIATFIYGYYNDPRFFFWLSVFNVLGNFYPVLLQRYNRIRVGKVLERIRR